MRSFIIAVLVSLGSVGAQAASFYTGPCDLISTGCTSSWSVTRAMTRNYSGNLFELYRSSDSTTLNIGQTAAQTVDLASALAFCAGTSCFYDKIYDQSGSNNLTQGTPTSMPPFTLGAKDLPIINTASGSYLDNLSTTGLPDGTANRTVGETGPGWLTPSACCGGFGMAENPPATTLAQDTADTGDMFAIIWWTPPGNAPQFGVDEEQILTTTVTVPYAANEFGEAKFDGTNVTTVLNGNVQTVAAPSHALNTGSRVTLGSAGDKTAVQSQFYEGFIAGKVTTSSEDAAVFQNNLAFYPGMFQGSASALTDGTAGSGSIVRQGSPVIYSPKFYSLPYGGNQFLCTDSSGAAYYNNTPCN